MFKFIFSVVVILALTYVGLGLFGYEVHPDNISYYMPKKSEISDSSKNALEQYLDTVKFQNKIHPLITKKKPGTGDDAVTSTMKSLLQVDKFDQMKKLKSDINAIQAKADERGKQIDDIMNGK